MKELSQYFYYSYQTKVNEEGITKPENDPNYTHYPAGYTGMRTQSKVRLIDPSKVKDVNRGSWRVKRHIRKMNEEIEQMKRNKIPDRRKMYLTFNI